MSSNLVPNTFPTSDGIVPNVAPIFGDMTFTEDTQDAEATSTDPWAQDLITDAPQILAQVQAHAPAKLTLAALTPAMEAAGRVAEEAQIVEDRKRALLQEGRNNVRILDEQIQALLAQKAQAEREVTYLLDDFCAAQQVAASALAAERLTIALTELI